MADVGWEDCDDCGDFTMCIDVEALLLEFFETAGIDEEVVGDLGVGEYSDCWLCQECLGDVVTIAMDVLDGLNEEADVFA